MSQVLEAARRASATIAVESMPPLRKMPTGTSLTKCRRIEDSSSDRAVVVATLRRPSAAKRQLSEPRHSRLPLLPNHRVPGWQRLDPLDQRQRLLNGAVHEISAQRP